MLIVFVGKDILYCFKISGPFRKIGLVKRNTFPVIEIISLISQIDAVLRASIIRTLNEILISRVTF